MISELPRASRSYLFSQTLSFQAHKDRLSLATATTSKDSLKKVETFCECNWSEIGASADHAYQEANGASASLRLEAHQTHLYTLGEPLGGFFGENLASAAEWKMLLSLEGDSSAFVTKCQVWDVPTRR
jgi:hypothetical protein